MLILWFGMVWSSPTLPRKMVISYTARYLALSNAGVPIFKIQVVIFQIDNQFHFQKNLYTILGFDSSVYFLLMLTVTLAYHFFSTTGHHPVFVFM